RHHGEPCGLHRRAAGHRHVEGERAGGADDLVAIEGAEEHVQLRQRAGPIDALRHRYEAERRADGEEQVVDALGRAGADLDGHAPRTARRTAEGKRPGRYILRLASLGTFGCARSWFLRCTWRLTSGCLSRCATSAGGVAENRARFWMSMIEA